MRRVYNLSTGGYQELEDAPVTPIVLSKQEAKDAIDLAADGARIRVKEAFVSKGGTTEKEYENTSIQVLKWRIAGSPANDVPRPITKWAASRGITDEAAAVELELQEAFLRGKIDDVRDLRLDGKKEVDDAASDWGTVAQPSIDVLNAYDPYA